MSAAQEIMGAMVMGAAEIAKLRKEKAELLAQRDEMFAALRRLSFAAMARDNTMGDQCRLIEVRAELSAANKRAMDVMAKVGGAS